MQINFIVEKLVHLPVIIKEITGRIDQLFKNKKLSACHICIFLRHNQRLSNLIKQTILSLKNDKNAYSNSDFH